MHSEPKCLLPGSIRRSDGSGPFVEVGEATGKLMVVTLGINDVLERQVLRVSLWGSPDGSEFGTEPLASFRPRQYCGVYSTLLNLANHPDVRYLRVQWSMHCQGKGDRTPLFGFHVFLEESGVRLGGAAGVRSYTQAMGAANWSGSRGHAA